jgi:hypothetical protein
MPEWLFTKPRDPSLVPPAGHWEFGMERTDDSDILLWNQKTDKLWVVEAVTSDGEVDRHKVESLTRLAERSGKTGIGFTTAYMTWRDAASRQGKHKNIAPGTYIWIREDGAKQFSVETFESSTQRLNQ